MTIKHKIEITRSNNPEYTTWRCLNDIYTDKDICCECEKNMRIIEI